MLLLLELYIQEAEAEVKPEIVTTLKGLYFHQEITKTEGQEGKPRIIVENMIKRKETFFRKVEQLRKNLKPSSSQLMGRLAEQEHNEVHIIPETRLSLNDEGEDVQVSTKNNNFLLHDQGAVHGRVLKNNSASKNT